MPFLNPSFTGYGFTAAVKAGFRRYVCFSGRATRSEFWYWVLFFLLISSIHLKWKGSIYSSDSVEVTITAIAIAPLLLLPTLGVTSRRLHDTEKSGWLTCLLIIPELVLPAILLLCLGDSQRGTNQYGPSEKYPDTP